MFTSEKHIFFQYDPVLTYNVFDKQINFLNLLNWIIILVELKKKFIKKPAFLTLLDAAQQNL